MHMNQENGMDPLLIHSRQWNYTVEFVEKLTDLPNLEEFVTPETFIVCDAQVADLHSEALGTILSSRPSLLVFADEATKSLHGVENLINWLIENRAVRSSRILAIGGGCIQDLVSFTAHLYYRGIDWIFLPTTVLSQSDSCIGAKSGINVLPFKNQLGVLHSPRRILIVREFLDTLPAIEIASGYGEIVKLSVTSTQEFFDFLELALTDGGLANPRLLSLTRASLRAKQEIIEFDEYEEDLRRILNYGHSFGHALEALSGHKVPHGIAVLWGIDLINFIGVRLGVTPEALGQRITTLIQNNFEYELSLRPTATELLDQLRRDKKFAHGVMNFVFLRELGNLEIVALPLDHDLLMLTENYLNTDYVFNRA